MTHHNDITTSIIPESELIINPDGSIYHLNLRPEQLANTIITVGDPDRVPKVSQYFDSIEHKVQKREFVTHTGTLNNKRLSVISTGIGTDNIDIVLNELDALVNIDLKTRRIKKIHTSLDIIRIGTSGCLQKDIPVDSFLVSSHGLGLDGLLHFYELENTESETNILSAFQKNWDNDMIKPYIAAVSDSLLSRVIDDNMYQGITATCMGFYAPQGRHIRANGRLGNLATQLSGFQYNNLRITNFEMETAGIYGMAQVLGHQAVSLNALLANRITNEFSNQPKKIVDQLIQQTLERITA